MDVIHLPKALPLGGAMAGFQPFVAPSVFAVKNRDALIRPEWESE